MFQKAFLLSLFSVAALVLAAQNIDVKHYHFSLTLHDSTNRIEGVATLQLKRQQQAPYLLLQLKSIQQGKGMRVQSVMGKGVQSFVHRNDSLLIRLNTGADSAQTITIRYGGVPQDGLIISKNKWGDRTFFADNWPDRAQHWLPCNDDLADKASVEFVVTAPRHYQVASNGEKVTEKGIIGKDQKQTHWREATPIPTKVMVIGVARFAVQQYADISLVPVSAWVYPQDSTKGFYDYALAPAILRFFNDYIGAYAYTKLANVQSKTIFGGMENASAIFYAENTVTGDRRSEGLIAHEIAHQWFGNTATEKSFAHLWLSEGFASYLTHVYLESKYGRDTLWNGLKRDRNQIVSFAKRWNHPVVDSTSDLMARLNANSYQKGSWILHMLRSQVGDAVFKKIVQTYYQQYKGSNAETKDFQQVAENVTGKDWALFFNQWLHTNGHPQLQVQWHQAADSSIQVTVKQLQATPFHFPLRIALRTATGALPMQQLTITKEEETFTLKGFSNIQQLALDPLTELLFEGAATKVN